MSEELYVKRSDMMGAIPDTIWYGEPLRERFQELKTYTMPMSAFNYLMLVQRIRETAKPDFLNRLWKMERRDPASAICIVQDWAFCNGRRDAITEPPESGSSAFSGSGPKELSSLFMSITRKLNVCVFDVNGELRKEADIMKDLLDGFFGGEIRKNMRSFTDCVLAYYPALRKLESMEDDDE